MNAAPSTANNETRYLFRIAVIPPDLIPFALQKRQVSVPLRREILQAMCHDAQINDESTPARTPIRAGSLQYGLTRSLRRAFDAFVAAAITR